MMYSTFVYDPLGYFFIVMLASLVLVPIAAFLSNRDKMGTIKVLLVVNLFVPCMTALFMIFTSGNAEMVQDFWARLFLYDIQPKVLAFIVLLMPCVVLLATAISLLFGYSKKQFCINKELSVMKGWGVLGFIVPVLIAPFLEELGWRGYGVDSLRANFDLFTTSLIFGVLWAFWHLPLFFVKGFYHHKLRDEGFMYVVNFFVSVIILAFFMNWTYYLTGRSILALALFHAVVNVSSMLFRTEAFTKCVATVILFAILSLVVVQNQEYFFSDTSPSGTELSIAVEDVVRGGGFHE